MRSIRNIVMRHADNAADLVHNYGCNTNRSWHRYRAGRPFLVLNVRDAIHFVLRHRSPQWWEHP